MSPLGFHQELFKIRGSYQLLFFFCHFRHQISMRPTWLCSREFPKEPPLIFLLQKSQLYINLSFCRFWRKEKSRSSSQTNLVMFKRVQHLLPNQLDYAQKSLGTKIKPHLGFSGHYSAAEKLAIGSSFPAAFI